MRITSVIAGTAFAIFASAPIFAAEQYHYKPPPSAEWQWESGRYDCQLVLKRPVDDLRLTYDNLARIEADVKISPQEEKYIAEESKSALASEGGLERYHAVLKRPFYPAYFVHMHIAYARYALEEVEALRSDPSPEAHIEAALVVNSHLAQVAIATYKFMASPLVNTVPDDERAVLDVSASELTFAMAGHIYCWSQVHPPG